MKETNPLLVQFWVTISVTISGKFSFYENNRNLIDSVLGNNLHN